MKVRRLNKTTRVGDPLDVRLKTPATAGYAWIMPSDEPDWRIVRTQRGAGALFGGPATDTYTIEMLKPGHATIAADLKRPWEEEPIERLEIRVNVLP